MLVSLFSLFLTLSRYIGFTKGLQITLENTITLGETTTISYVTGSSDPSEWLLRNVYANGTTQIGGVLSGTGSVSFSFQLAGPHFLQAVAYNDSTSTATSQPFYTGNLFTPVNSSGTSSSSASATPSASCPSASSTPTTSPSSSTSSSSSESGAIAGEVIGVLGFLAALIFFGMWFRLYRQQHRKPEFAQTFMQTSGNNGNGHGVVLTPVIVTPYDGPAPTQRIASWMRRLYRPSKYLDEADMKEANIGDDSDTTRSMR